MTTPLRLDGRTRPELPVTHYLDNRIYTDDAVFADEMDTIFRHCWKFVCHGSELSDAFAFRLVEVAGHELILVRGEDEVIRSFYNVCPHRGARVLRKPAGTLEQGQMKCFYHLWKFDSTGQCLTVSQPSGYRQSQITREGTGLKPVRVATIFDLVFVCLDDAAPSLEDFLGAETIEAMRVPFGSAELEVFHFHRSEFQANWKLFVETNREGYHELLHVLNRTTGVAQQEYRKRTWRLHGNGHISFDPARIGYERLNYEKREEHVLPGMTPDLHVVVNLFPDMMLNCRSTVVRIDSLVPLSADRTLLECRGLGVKGDSAATRAMRIRHHNQVWGPTGINLAEDLWAVQTQMQNMLSGSSRYSVIAREEEGPTCDSSLRDFYAEWGRLTGRRAHEI